jgi:phytoene synthase
VAASCKAILARGSKSFSAASRLLPERLREPVAAYYAFCRVSDDAVDLSSDPAEALGRLRHRLDRIYDGWPADHPADRGLAWVAEHYGLPRVLIEALLEGYQWDVEGRTYRNLSGVRAYSARVAGSVGVVMTLLMGERRPEVLWRAADMGVAMQLTNICRDVGEDARSGRLFLPLDWLEAEGITPEDLFRDARYRPGVGVVVCRLLDEAERLYRRGDEGIGDLPEDCRTAIRAARLIYADIGRIIRQRGYDSVASRAYTSTVRKAQLAARALPSRYWPPRAKTFPTPGPLPEVEFLVAPVDSRRGEVRVPQHRAL